MKITQEILHKYGYTEGCDSCRYKSAGFHENREHNLECRTRIEKAMMEDTVDREKWEKDNERINSRIAAQMEKSIDEKNEEEMNHRDAAYEDQAAQGLKSDDYEKEKEKEHKSEKDIAEEQMPQDDEKEKEKEHKSEDNIAEEQMPQHEMDT